MMRQASSRNQRSKGFRVKNALQLCLLAAVCFWLLYQLKHSYDKKRTLEEKNLETWDKFVENQSELKLGRKDLPRGEEDVSGNETPGKEEDNEEVEEEEQEQETRQALEDEEARGDGDDEIDEQDQERADEREDQERADEEAEIGEELTNEEDKDGQGEETEQLDEQDPEEDSSHKAREESYRRDDVSSAVRRENQAKNSEDEDGDAGEKVMGNTEEKDADADDMADGADDGSKGNSHSSVGEADVSKDNVTGAVLAGNETRLNDHPTVNDTAIIEQKRSEVGLNNSEGSLAGNQIELHVDSMTASITNDHVESRANSTTAVSSYQTETKTNSTIVDAIADSVPLQNETVGRDSVRNHSVTAEMEASRDDKINLKNVVTEGQAERFNTTVGQEDAGRRSSASLGAHDDVDAIQGESTDSSHKTIAKEDTDSHEDLPTLSDMRNEARSMGDEAAKQR